MWLPRGLSADGASKFGWGMAKGCPRKKLGSGSGRGGMFCDMSATQQSNVCQPTAMADTQLLEHSGGSGLDDENRLLWRVSRVCESCLPTVVVEGYHRESRAVAVESF